MNIFLLEDNLGIRKEINFHFEKDGNNSVVNVIKELDVFEYILKDGFDIYILDLETKFVDVFEVIKYIRKLDKNTPIITINGSSDIKLMKKAYEAGCSEYLKKPFLTYELDMRISKVIKKQPDPVCIYFKKDFFYNKNTKQFYYNNYPVNIPAQEQKFCELLFDSLNSTVRYNKIINHMWGHDPYRDDYPLRQLVKRVRDSLPYNIIKVNSKIGYLMVKESDEKIGLSA